MQVNIAAVSFVFQDFCRTLLSCFISTTAFYATVNKRVQSTARETYCDINKASGSHLNLTELRVSGDRQYNLRGFSAKFVTYDSVDLKNRK
jgi:hypothetical protein